MGIEPTTSAWKAGVLPLNYTRVLTFDLFSIFAQPCGYSVFNAISYLFCDKNIINDIG